MKLIFNIGTYILQLIYNVMRCCRTKKRIVFISRQSNEITEDFRLLIGQISTEHPEIQCIVLCKMIPNTIVGKVGYGLHMLKQMYYITTSKVVVLDTYCIVVSLLSHREGLTVIQIWHALGAMKKFGYSTVGAKEGTTSEVAGLMKMHENYDYVVTSSEFCRKFYAEAFNVDMKKVVVYPLPRLDKMNREVKREEYKILYAPTFRKEQLDITKVVRELVREFENSEYTLTVKLHPLSTCDKELSISDEELSKLLNESDIIITDYSSLIFEASYLNKKIILYAYDFDSYKENRDFYLDYMNDLPYVVCTDAKVLKQKINDYNTDMIKTKEFCEKYIRTTDEKFTVELANFIISKI